MIKLTNFSLRHFKEDFGGTKILDRSPEDFERQLNQSAFMAKVIPGYAPFCKLLVYENWTSAKAGTVLITSEIEQKIKTAYQARTETELPVLSRWVEGVEMPKAKYLVVVVYDGEQILKEGQDLNFNGKWGVVAIMGQNHDEEEPMTPITMMRNALGVEEGGSGVPIDKEKYKQSVEFWSRNVMVKN